MAGHNTILENEDQPLLTSFNLTRDGEERDNHGSESGLSHNREILERSLLRKLDRRMSILILIYILNYIDRNNASAARLRGFEEDLHLKGSQFATILSILYIGYILMQIPSNMFLNYFGKPSKYLPWCMIIWGALSVCTGFTTSFFGALCTRFLLGFVEAAFFPGALFLISKWYKRNELSERTALLACGILLSNAFGSLIASGILDSMEGVLGYAAWRWLFFVEGSATIIVAIWSLYILPDFPESKASWLTPSEQALAIQRMAEDAGVSGESLVESYASESSLGQWPGLRLAVYDWKVWWLALSLTSMVVSLSFNAYFPTLGATLGYGPTKTLLLCAPPWLFATGVAVTLSRHSDKSGERCKHIISSLCVGLVGFILAMSTMNTMIRYLSLFLMAQSYAGFIVFLAWASGSVAHPPAKRAVALALINCVSQLGNVAGSYVWPSSWGPSYNLSYSICILTSALSITMCYIFRRHLAGLNHKREKLEADRGEVKGYRYML
ncbi:MFS general substrate transporter [Crassisporium funariophilum]|nr:MFS general substrate transporter [Crassisporium funariophilum]